MWLGSEGFFVFVLKFSSHVDWIYDPGNMRKRELRKVRQLNLGFRHQPFASLGSLSQSAPEHSVHEGILLLVMDGPRPLCKTSGRYGALLHNMHTHREAKRGSPCPLSP